MIAAIFEVEPAPGQRDTYLDLIARLEPLLEQMDGSISIKRFQSTMNPDKMLPPSFFRDEEAVKAWRSPEQHRDIQHASRDRTFADYRLRTAHMVYGRGTTNRDETPTGSCTEHV